MHEAKNTKETGVLFIARNKGQEGVLRFGLDGDVLPAAQNPYSYLGVIFHKNMYPFLAILPQKHNNFSNTNFLWFAKILKTAPITRDFFMKNETHV